MAREKFQEELQLINDESIREFVGYVLDNAPKAYFIREASSTNKYHPPSSRGYEGLLRHVKRCVYVAEQLLRNNIYQKLVPHHDTIIAALILHDCKKYGDNNSKWSLKNHAELAAYWIADMQYDKLNEITRKEIAQLVLTHMGQWGRVVPSNSLEKFVHLCDYIASLKELEREVEDMPIKEMAIDAKSVVDDNLAIQLKLPLEKEEDNELEKSALASKTDDEFLKDILS